jgi:hypothetical protein
MLLTHLFETDKKSTVDPRDLVLEQANPEDYDDYEDEDEDLRLRSGDYVRDQQDGESGEIFRMQGDPSERRVQILDRDGRGWYIAPDRLTRVDPQDPDVQRYFGKQRQRDMDEAIVASGPSKPLDDRAVRKMVWDTMKINADTGEQAIQRALAVLAKKPQSRMVQDLQDKFQSLADRLAQGVAEGWSDAYVARRTGTPRTPYSVYIKGKKWKDFENDDHARAVMDKLKAKFKADGRDPETITIAPTDMSDDFKEAMDMPPDVPPAVIAPAPAAKYMAQKPQAPRAQANEPAPKHAKGSIYSDDETTLKVYKPEQYREEKTRLDPKCWTGKKIGNPKTKVKGGVRVNNCVPAESVEENKTLAKRVRVVKTGETGTIRQIKPGAFKGAPKTYYVDLDNGGQADNLPATALRLIKTQEGRREVDEVSKDTLGRYIKLAGIDAADRASSSSYKSGAAGDKYNKADPSRQEVSRERGIDRAIKKITK